MIERDFPTSLHQFFSFVRDLLYMDWFTPELSSCNLFVCNSGHIRRSDYGPLEIEISTKSCLPPFNILLILVLTIQSPE